MSGSARTLPQVVHRNSYACAALVLVFSACSEQAHSSAELDTQVTSTSGQTAETAPTGQTGESAPSGAPSTASAATSGRGSQLPAAGVATAAAGKPGDSSAAQAGTSQVQDPSAAGARAEDGMTSSAGSAGTTSAAWSGSAGAGAAPVAGADATEMAAGASTEAFTLMPVGFPMAGDELTFPVAANPPTNASPEFTWTGVPADARSLALAFRDLGNGAVKWVIWDIPPDVTHLPPDITPVAMPPEVPGSSQLGSLNNQGYAGPGSGARLYDFTLWALDVEHLTLTGRESTVDIHDEILAMHEIAKTEPILVRNTRNLP